MYCETADFKAIGGGFTHARRKDVSVKAEKRDDVSFRLLFVFSLLYAFLLIYASLMPFDVVAVGNIESAISRFWRVWPVDPRARFSGSDVLSNLLLYMPLGWLIAVRAKLSGGHGLAAMMRATMACASLSIVIEMTQLAVASRISSAADWAFNTISGSLGAIAGVCFGTRIWIQGIHWLKTRWRTNATDIGTLIFTLLLAADAWAPYMPTLLRKQVWRSLEASHFNVLEGLDLQPWHWWLATRICLYLVLTVLIAAWGEQAKPPSLRASLRGAVVASVLAFIFELGKLFIVSRVFDAANLATAWIGCLSGALVFFCLWDKLRVNTKLELISAAVFCYLVYIWWFPFDFVWDGGHVRSGLPAGVEMLPLYHYAMGAKLDHIRLFVKSIFLLGLLTVLLRIRFGWGDAIGSKGGRILAAAFLAGGFGMALEAGQLLLPSRTSSMTDAYCFALGAGIGAWLPLPRNGQGEQPGRETIGRSIAKALKQ